MRAQRFSQKKKKKKKMRAQRIGNICSPTAFKKLPTPSSSIHQSIPTLKLDKLVLAQLITVWPGLYSIDEIRQIIFGTTYNSLAFGQGYLQMMKLEKLLLAQRITVWRGLSSN